ncbi:transcription factor GTE3, chloroplastic-like [Lathyrus oleraceus]|uniref:transcription factor GTE3, chloroplastic-like n=1 Tax=Pisum sativum TaxID=3888 RepID=UPI0021D0CC5A|nr:transcription factor GTE3, chloroplastic-like [Pisum sativum]
MSEKTQPRKRLIVKLSYPPGSRKRDSNSCATYENKRRKIQDSVKPVVTCYWVDSNYQTKSTALSQTKDSNIVVENKKIIKNQVSNTVTSQPKGSNIVVENKKIIKIKNQVSNTVTSQPKDSNIVVENKKILKNQVSNTIPLSQPKDNDNVVEDKKILKNQVSKTEIAFNGPKESSRHCSKPASVTRGEECGLKEPMDGVKRRQCWLILKRMLVDRDGWDLKDPPKIAKSDKCKTKAIGLKEIERKMRLYATPDEFASDMRLVFSNAMVTYPPRNHIYQIAKKFSDTFEHKWKSLKNMWELEDTKRSNTHKRY